MRYKKALTNWLTAATVAIIALSNVALFLISRNANLHWVLRDNPFWPMTLATGIATVLVMSILETTLNELYDKLAKREAQAREDSRRDPLTRLGNRKYLIEMIERHIERGLGNRVSALLIIDLDQFKRVNDTLGHAAGDDLIVQVGRRLLAAAQGAAVSRLGGDEFALIIDASSDRALEEHCDQIHKAITGAYALDANEVVIGASVGSAPFEAGLDASEMMRRADIAMYRAKAAGVAHRQFDQDMLGEIERRSLMEGRLRLALKTGAALSALFQPQVDQEGKVVALETLLRWNDELLGEVSPLKAIAVAEEARLIDELGIHIAEQACGAAVALPDLRISLNISSIQLLDNRFCGYLGMLVRKYHLEAGRMNLEIPEKVIVEMGERIFATMHDLSKAGFRLVIDNYGSSTSNLTYLQRAAVSAIKLDQSMLSKTHDDGSVAVMRARVTLAKSLGLDVICCGIADARDQAVAVGTGCDLFQGFYHARPEPLEDIVMRLGERDALARRRA